MTPLIEFFEHLGFISLIIFFSLWLRKITINEIEEEYLKIKSVKLAMMGGSIILLGLVSLHHMLLLYAIMISAGWLFLFSRLRKQNIVEIGFSPLAIILISPNDFLLKIGYVMLALDAFSAKTLMKKKINDREKKEKNNFDKGNKSIPYWREFILEVINYSIPLSIASLAVLS